MIQSSCLQVFFAFPASSLYLNTCLFDGREGRSELKMIQDRERVFEKTQEPTHVLIPDHANRNRNLVFRAILRKFTGRFMFENMSLACFFPGSIVRGVRT